MEMSSFFTPKRILSKDVDLYESCMCYWAPKIGSTDKKKNNFGLKTFAHLDIA